jgi:hypothetical protein
MAILTALLASAPLVQAQNRVEVKDLDFDKRRTPDYNTDLPGRPRREDYDWLRITCTLDVDGGRDEWVDEIVLDWYVLVGVPGPDILMHREITYIDVGEGEQHGCVFIPNNFFRKYTGDNDPDEDNLRVLVRVKVNGEYQAGRFYPEGRPRSNWWTDSDNRSLDRYLLARPETPFAPLAWWYYMFIKPGSLKTPE